MAEKSEKKRSKRTDVEPVKSETSRTEAYHLRLFVAGDEVNSVQARRNLDEILGEHVRGECRVEIIDVFEDFTEAIAENILVTPALIVDKPKRAVVFGNLEDRDTVLATLGVL